VVEDRIGEYLNRALTKFAKEVDHKVAPLSLEKTANMMIEHSKTLISGRPTWTTSGGSIYAGYSYTVEGKKASIYNNAPEAYLRQWGETVTGKKRIHPTGGRKYLFINNTGLSTQQFKDLSKKERNGSYQYGIDYFFAKSVSIVANPYIAAPGLTSAGTKTMFDKMFSSDSLDDILKAVEDYTVKIAYNILRKIAGRM
jgi:hypothetical protein